jgi:DsbC/DsbD-like thiol-disulfide interchange protein
MAKRTIFRFTILLFGLTIYAASQGQNRQANKPVKWIFSVENSGKNEANVIITATMKDGWHIYSRFLEEGGPSPTKFTFETSDEYMLVGTMKDEGKLVEKYDSTFLMPIAWFEGKAVFTQRVKLKIASASIKGKVVFMACTEQECLLPEEITFKVETNTATSSKKILQKGDKR